MNRYITLILALLLTVSTQAQKRISREYNNVSLSDALRQLSEQQTGYTIYFLYNELEDFRITTTVKNKHLPEAIQQMIGFYPIRVTTSTEEEGKKIFVECIQKTESRYKGTIIDETGQPVAYANVYLLHPSDSTLIGGGVSNEAGLFVIPCETNPVLARISFIGYKTVYKYCHSTELGTIRMQPDSYKLKGVEVKGSRPLVRIKDVLAHIPGVIRNGNSIEVIGRGTPLIYINGRQMRNQSELDQLSSDQIKDVEVVMTPGAKYDATVKAVIRIKTIRPVGEGFSFNSRTVAGVNHYVYGLEELNLNYRTGGLDIFGMAEYENHRSRQTNDSRQDTYLQSHYQQNSLMHYYNKNQMLAGKLGFNYMLNDNHSIGMTYTITSRPNSQTSDYFTTMLIGQQTDDQITGRGKVDGDDIQHIISGYYAGQTGKWSLDATTT